MSALVTNGSLQPVTYKPLANDVLTMIIVHTNGANGASALTVRVLQQVTTV